MDWPPSEPSAAPPLILAPLVEIVEQEEPFPGDPNVVPSQAGAAERGNVESLEEWENQQYLPPPRVHRCCHTVSSGHPRRLSEREERSSSPAPHRAVPDSLQTTGACKAHDLKQQSATFRERNALMLFNEEMADVWFVVGSAGKEERIPAHSYVLAVGSFVFHAMFYGVFPVASEVAVPDVEVEAFRNMLRYLYTDEVYLNPDTVISTLYAAKKYLIDHLIRACVEFLQNSLNSSNVCFLLSQSRLFEEEQLVTRCWEVLDAQAELALCSDSFLDIDLDTLKLVLTRETLNARETKVYEAAVGWAEAECRRRRLDITSNNIREVLGSAFYMLRFPAMKTSDFANVVAKSGLLTADEVMNIFLHHFADEKPILRFPGAARTGLALKRCHRFQSCAYRNNQWRYRGRCDSIQFCTDRRIFIAGFGLFGSSNGATKYMVRFELKRSGQVLASLDTCFCSDGSSKVFPVFFEQPVQIEADVYYTAGIVLEGNELSYFGQEGLPEVQVHNVTFQFQVSTESTNGTGVQGGQIPEILFY